MWVWIAEDLYRESKHIRTCVLCSMGIYYYIGIIIYVNIDSFVFFLITFYVLIETLTFLGYTGMKSCLILLLFFFLVKSLKYQYLNNPMIYTISSYMYSFLFILYLSNIIRCCCNTILFLVFQENFLMIHVWI